MTEPTPKYHIGDIVRIFSNEPIDVLKRKEEELAELKEYLPENLQKKISKLEAEIKELKGEQ